MTELQPVITADNLRVEFGKHQALLIDSFQVLPREKLAIIGPNGAGKTTLLLCLALLLKPQSGIIRYHGIPVTGEREKLQFRRQFALVFQEPLLLNTGVWENVLLGMKFRGIAGDTAAARSKMWLERFGVAHLAGRHGRFLSGGEAKRVSLARAFALQPEVLFLDEPFTGLDSPTRQALTDDFETVLRETSVTTVMVTHDRNEALALADRVAVIIDGKIRQTGTPEQVFNYPADEEVANFVEAGNIWQGKVIAQNDGLVTIAVGNRQIEAVSNLKTGENVTICLKFEDITLAPAGDPLPFGGLPPFTSARNSLTGKITRIVNLGAQVRVTVGGELPVTALITRRSFAGMGLKEGMPVSAAFKASAIHLISRG